MKTKLLSFLFGMALIGSVASATDQGKSYLNVKSASCSGSIGDITLNVMAQELEGRLSDQGRSFEFTFERLKQEPDADYKVGVIFNFLDSGYDLLGAQVTTVGEDEDSFSFGTYAIVLDKKILPSQEMTVIYVEAMTGWQSTSTMNCNFYE